MLKIDKKTPCLFAFSPRHKICRFPPCQRIDPVLGKDSMKAVFPEEGIHDLWRFRRFRYIHVGLLQPWAWFTPASPVWCRSLCGWFGLFIAFRPSLQVLEQELGATWLGELLEVSAEICSKWKLLGRDPVQRGLFRRGDGRRDRLDHADDLIIWSFDPSQMLQTAQLTPDFSKSIWVRSLIGFGSRVAFGFQL